MYKTNVDVLVPETADLIRCLRSSLAFTVGFFNQNEAMDVAQSALTAFAGGADATSPQYSWLPCEIRDEIP